MYWMRSSEVELEDPEVALFLRDGLDGRELQKLHRGGKLAFQERFQDKHASKEALLQLQVAVQELKFDENDVLEDELQEELEHAVEEVLQRAPATNAKFFTEPQFLVFGQPTEAAWGLAHYMCVGAKALDPVEGEKSIIYEIQKYGTDEVLTPPHFPIHLDMSLNLLRGCDRGSPGVRTRSVWSTFCMRWRAAMPRSSRCVPRPSLQLKPHPGVFALMPSLERAMLNRSLRLFQGKLKRDCDKDGNLHPDREVSDGNGGRRGMVFEDFLLHPSVGEANLSRAHVLALYAPSLPV